MRTIFEFEVSFRVDNIILTVSLELATGGAHLRWTAYDAVRAEHEERDRFYRPTDRVSVLGLDERFRRHQA